MPYIGSEALVSTNWLAENINNQNVIVIDASLPRVGVTEDRQRR